MAFLIDILTGLLVSFFYDLFRSLRHRIQRKKPNAILDILFWLFAGSLILSALFYNSDMALRAYEFLGILTGVFFYFSFLSSLLQPVFEKITGIFDFFSKILFTILRLFGIIIKNGFLFLSMPFRLLARFSKRGFGKWKTHLWKQRKLMKRI